MTKPTAEEARALFSYDKLTGRLTWRVDRISKLKRGAVIGGNAIAKARAGEVAGGIRPDGRRTVVIDGKLYLDSRVAWLIEYGEWPSKQVDHINGNPNDNRLSNLRLASASENGRNRGQQANNKSGFKGVSWAARERKWNARIMAQGQYRSLGYFDTAEQAAEAYAKAAAQYHGKFARTA